ncbi:hypothetical protein BKA61DRAFT_477458 [Leptodontidium sp. MPI-SDFR-AT-0119]|nr:hypothetical protein BKA61DRAFT_477458 [Leptodontidium sp. MPI-SDFR-AT-0119]
MTSTIVLISGANRGLGKGLVELYLAKPNHTVIAANRDPENASSKALAKLTTGSGSRLIVVKTDASVETDALEAVKALSFQGIEHIDVVIANAGVSYTWPKVSELKIEDLQGHLVPNVFGVVWLYQATLPFLLKSNNPKFATIGSTAGNLEVSRALPVDYVDNSCRNQPPIPNAAYGTSKAAVHWLTKRIDAEEEKLTAFVISPGWCKTEMGNTGARHFGMAEAIVEPADSCRAMVELIDAATKETHGGMLWDVQDGLLAW